MTKKQKSISKPLACCLFSMRPITCESLLRFEKAATSLVEEQGVRRFYVISEYCDTGYLRILERLSKSAEIELVAVTHYTDPNPEWLEERTKDLVPPFHRVENIDTGTRLLRYRILRRIKAMLDLSDYCFVNSSEYPLEKSILVHIKKRLDLTVLDLGEAMA